MADFTIRGGINGLRGRRDRRLKWGQIKINTYAGKRGETGGSAFDLALYVRHKGQDVRTFNICAWRDPAGNLRIGVGTAPDAKEAGILQQEAWGLAVAQDEPDVD